MVASKPAFELPLSQISNTSLANKNEVSLEFNHMGLVGVDGDLDTGSNSKNMKC